MLDSKPLNPKPTSLNPKAENPRYIIVTILIIVVIIVGIIIVIVTIIVVHNSNSKPARCPPTLVGNWARELRRWGPFEVEAVGGWLRVEG